AAFSIYDPATNRRKRVFRSTRTRNEEQAREICRAWHKAAIKAETGTLSIDAAREIIAQGVSDVFMRANAASMPRASIKSWCEMWLQAKEIEVEQSTCVSYEIAVRRFIDFLGDAQSNRDIATLHSTDVARFRNHEATRLSRGTVNLRLTVLRICFGDAKRQ